MASGVYGEFCGAGVPLGRPHTMSVASIKRSSDETHKHRKRGREEHKFVERTVKKNVWL